MRTPARSARLLQIVTLLRQFVADRKIIGAVGAVARRGKVTYLEPVGLQSLDTRAPMTEASLFRVYSMTKAVTAVGVMMLVEEGKLRLSDPASKYLPEFKNMKVQEGGTGTPRSPSRDITIQDVLLHTC
jgi:CubicO group peptidase (beta-lactamase class C family)